MKFPMGPGTKNNGMNAAMLVSTAKVIGPEISFGELHAANVALIFGDQIHLNAHQVTSP